VQRRLATAAAEWTSARREPSFLVGGARLVQFGALAADSGVALNAQERAFLDASLAERDRVQRAEAERSERELAQERATARAQRSAANRLRYLVGALAIFLVVAIGLSTYAFQQRRAADQQRRAAEANAAEAERQRGEAQANLTLGEAQRLAAEANRLVAQQGNVDVATLLAIRSIHTQYTSQGDEAIAEVSQLTYPERVLTAHTADICYQAVMKASRGCGIHEPGRSYSTFSILVQYSMSTFRPTER
jgi:hypothetical protein